MQVRLADVDDIEHLARLRAEWRGQPASDEFRSAFAEWFGREQSGRWWWIAVDRGVPVGMVNVKLFERMPSPGRVASRWGYLANLFVLPDRRGGGVGGALIAAAVDRARREGLVRLVLAPSERSIPLYRRHGFGAASDLLLLPLQADERP